MTAGAPVAHTVAMKAFAVLLLFLALASCGSPSRPHGQTGADLTVEQAWAAPTPAGVDVSAAYLTVRNGAVAGDRLLGATSPRADRIEIHEMSMDGAVMRMRTVETIPIAPDEAVVLAPGGMHLMFYGVREPFAEGENIPVRLRFQNAGEIDVVMPVRRVVPGEHGAH